MESKQNDTTINVPGDNVVTNVISPGGGGSNDKSDGPTVLPSNSPLCGKQYYINNIWRKKRVESTGLEN